MSKSNDSKRRRIVSSATGKSTGSGKAVSDLSKAVDAYLENPEYQAQFDKLLKQKLKEAAPKSKSSIKKKAPASKKTAAVKKTKVVKKPLKDKKTSKVAPIERPAFKSSDPDKVFSKATFLKEIPNDIATRDIKLPTVSHSRKVRSPGLNPTSLRSMDRAERAQHVIPEVMELARAYNIPWKSEKYEELLEVARSAIEVVARGNGLPLTTTLDTYSLVKRVGLDNLARLVKIEKKNYKIFFPTKATKNEDIAALLAQFEMILFDLDSHANYSAKGERKSELENLSSEYGPILTKKFKTEWTEGMPSIKAIENGIPSMTAEAARAILSKNKAAVKLFGGLDSILYAPYNWFPSERRFDPTFEKALQTELLPAATNPDSNEHILKRRDRLCLSRILMTPLPDLELFLFAIAFGWPQHHPSV
ncbi:MAG: hypothetical protein EOP06_08320 [Proteobacteria bacterium]|nr:MAG: hypothetical protein EOP06_08320 [Pseudomonadota bacterium]